VRRVGDLRGVTEVSDSATLVVPSQRPRPLVICKSADGAGKVGTPRPGCLVAESTEKSRDGVRRTAEFTHVCRRSLKTEEREPKASTGDDGLI
jgi:hypothetical protein